MAVAINGPIPRCPAGHVYMPERGYRHQSSGHVILFGPAGDLCIQFPDLRLEVGECHDQYLQSGDGIGGYAAVRVLDDGEQFRCVGRPLRHNLAELGQMTTRHARGVLSARRVDRLCALPDQQLPDTKDHRRALGLFTLHGNKTHGRADRCFTDRLSICRVVFLALDEGLDVSWRDQPNVMAKLADLAPPEVSASTGFHRDNASRQLPEKLQHLRSPQLFAQNPPARAIGPMDLKYSLRQPVGDCCAFACRPTDRARP